MLAIVAIFIAPSIFADEVKLRVAVLYPTSSGMAIDEGTKIAVREIVSSTIVNAGNYDIVERSSLEKVMQERQFSDSGMVNDADVTEIGKIAGADKLVLSVVTLAGDRTMISIKMIDVETASVERQKVKVVSSEELFDVVAELTLALIASDGNVPTVGSAVSVSSHNADSHNVPAVNAVSVNDQIPNTDGSCLTYTPCRYNITEEIPVMWEMLKTEYFSNMHDCNHFNVILDFSDARINGVHILNYLNSRAKLDNSVYSKMEIMANRFLKGLNETSRKFARSFTWSYNTSLPVTLVVKVRTVDPDGRDNLSDYYFVDTADGTVLAGLKMTASGGRYGSFANLLGDAFEETAAPRVVRFLKSALNSSR